EPRVVEERRDDNGNDEVVFDRGKADKSYDNIQSYNESKSFGIEVKDGEPTRGCEALEAAFMAWKMRIETFKAQVKVNKDKEVDLKDKEVDLKDLDEACKTWISK
ncbi:1545_t:CDS:2, partial [Gigaspora rosea]